ncbi:MAG: polysaccharide deacetylase family protein [Cyanobacteriota bacterium SKYGB_h_bin112]|nr:polysaccharide deacetylase family protein [Cyanobacteriota bacterium SKYGB_h_bin112]
MALGNLPRRAVVVTFDDGYADNFYVAKTLLEQHDVPATVFVTAGFVGKSEEFWWDDLDRILLRPGTLPAIIQLSVDGEEYQQNLGAVSEYSIDSYKMHQHWTVLSPDSPTERQIAYRQLCQLVYPLSADRRQDVQHQLWQQIGSGSIGRDTHRVMNPEEVAQLAASGLIEVGAHTMSHLSLSAQSIAVQRLEIQQSKARLEEIVGQPVTSFAYPFGSPSDYTADTVDLVQEAGFQLACSNFGGVVTRQSDRFQLPRVLVRNWDGDEFERRLREWLA